MALLLQMALSNTEMEILKKARNGCTQKKRVTSQRHNGIAIADDFIQR